MRHYIITLFAFALLFANPVHAEEAIESQGILAVAKMAGACGILDSMSHFQATTKMPGGDEFIARFWSTEASRLGYSPEQYIEHCKGAIASYDKLWSAAEAPKK